MASNPNRVQISLILGDRAMLDVKTILSIDLIYLRKGLKISNCPFFSAAREG